jgi:hypothetical protein
MFVAKCSLQNVRYKMLVQNVRCTLFGAQFYLQGVCGKVFAANCSLKNVLCNLLDAKCSFAKRSCKMFVYKIFDAKCSCAKYSWQNVHLIIFWCTGHVIVCEMLVCKMLGCIVLVCKFFVCKMFAAKMFVAKCSLKNAHVSCKMLVAQCSLHNARCKMCGACAKRSCKMFVYKIFVVLGRCHATESVWLSGWRRCLGALP